MLPADLAFYSPIVRARLSDTRRIAREARSPPMGRNRKRKRLEIKALRYPERGVESGS